MSVFLAECLVCFQSVCMFAFLSLSKRFFFLIFLKKSDNFKNQIIKVTKEGYN
jgi:hypothetical protein